MSGSAYGPSIQIARFWEKTSAKTGLVYYVGRLGPSRITILPNRNKTEEPENSHDMVVLLSEATPAQPRPVAQTGHPVLPLAPPASRESPPWESVRASPRPPAARKATGQHKVLITDNDPMPF
jgi:hypothetical protein